MTQTEASCKHKLPHKEHCLTSNTIKCLVTQHCYIPLQVKTNVSYAGNLICRKTLSDVNTLFKVEKTIKCH